LREALAGLSPEIARIAGYHFGFVDADGRPSDGDGGKAVRPALALLSAEAVGAPPELALSGAVAIELVHNFSLLHDDVMDHDLERRHRPTAWAVFGLGQAIVTGDALMVLAQEVVRESPAPGRSKAGRALASATASMIAGQAEDLSFEGRLDVSVDECLRMMANKTGALLSCASSIGAILAGASDDAVAALSDFGLHLGLAFQAVDDLLGIWGHPEVTGKPVASDLRAHKKSLPVVSALASSSPDRDRLFHVLSNGSLSEDLLVEAAALVERCGGRDGALEEAERQLQEARAALGRVPLVAEAREQLDEIAAFVAARDF
jgi:geranylgeranyl diphosphate synthase type I